MPNACLIIDKRRTDTNHGGIEINYQSQWVTEMQAELPPRSREDQYALTELHDLEIKDMPVGSQHTSSF